MVVLAILPTGESASMMSPTVTVSFVAEAGAGCPRDVGRGRMEPRPVKKRRRRESRARPATMARDMEGGRESAREVDYFGN
jgi:hypothetical protein